jgi:hypothetical protein
VYLHDGLVAPGQDLLPLAALNSATVLHAEIVGRSYGGGILKLEPREADRWLVPSAELVDARAAELRAVRRTVAGLLSRGRLLDAVHTVDTALGLGGVDSIRAARDSLATRRAVRSRRAR